MRERRTDGRTIGVVGLGGQRSSIMGFRRKKRAGGWGDENDEEFDHVWNWSQRTSDGGWMDKFALCVLISSSHARLMAPSLPDKLGETQFHLPFRISWFVHFAHSFKNRTRWVTGSRFILTHSIGGPIATRQIRRDPILSLLLTVLKIEPG